MKFAPIFTAAIFLTGLAEAATVTMRFETTVDATEFGGTATTPLVVTYSFDSTLASGSGPFTPDATSDSYGPLSSMEISVGNQTLSGVAGTGIVVMNDTPDGDVLFFRVAPLEDIGTLFGLRATFFRFMIVDPSGTMFDDLSLPTSLNITSSSGYYQQTDFTLIDSNFMSYPLGVNEFDGMPPGELTPFTLTVVPEPGPSAIFGVALLGAAWIRRRGRR